MSLNPSEENVRKKRPERQLYIPPAQRISVKRISRKGDLKYHHKQSVMDESGSRTRANDRVKIQLKDDKSLESTTNILENNGGEQERVIDFTFIDDLKMTNRYRRRLFEESLYNQSQVTIEFSESRVERDLVIENSNESTKNNIDDSILDGQDRIFSLHDLMHLQSLPLTHYCCAPFRKINDSSLFLTNFHNFCNFRDYLVSKFDNHWGFPILLYSRADSYFLHLTIKNYFCWQPFLSDDYVLYSTEIDSKEADKFFNFIRDPDKIDLSDECIYCTFKEIKLRSKIRFHETEKCGLVRVPSTCSLSETETIFAEDFDMGYPLRLVYDTEMFENVIDLTEFSMGHFLKVTIDDDVYYNICEEIHDVRKCYMDFKEEKICIHNTKSALKKTEEQNKTVHKPPDTPSEPNSAVNQKIVNTKPLGAKKKCVLEEEKEIMRRAKVNINRKTKPLMKYSDDREVTLQIGKQDNINNWEDLFDDSGVLQEELLTEIVHNVRPDMTIMNGEEDYSPYINSPISDFDHVVEIYDFPTCLRAPDIIHLFSMCDIESMYIVWINEAKALLVLGSSSQAEKAAAIQNPLIKVRPMSCASPIALETARKNGVRPAMKRPVTNLQTARRLITSHLGARNTVTREQNAMERENLRQAKENRRRIRQEQMDAWEGNIHSSLFPAK